LTIRDLEKDCISDILDRATFFKSKLEAGEDCASGKQLSIGLVFFEGSTRTRVSFEQAAGYLGHRSVQFTTQGSSVSKGESLKDTILTLKHEHLNVLVIRHPANGSPALAAKYFGGPVINAGDGQHEHPTQALGDAMTILEAKGRIEGLNIAIVGDILHSRVARSNAWLLSKFGANVRLVGPRCLMPSHMRMLPGEVHYDLVGGIDQADVVVCLRLQKERMTEGFLTSPGEYRRGYQINVQTLRYAKRDCIVMHPGPMNRGVEVDDVTADGPRSVILKQVENSVFVRMAAFDWVLGSSEPKATSKPVAKKGGKKK
jgi:aspartate carbamoyltransferase catalytic subunit